LVLFCLGPALALLTLAGAFTPIDRLLGDLNFALWSRPAASDLVLVEIDSRSVEKLNSWPWSRAYHAMLIQQLSKAGAAAIAFDVDFSAPSAPAADAQLAQAIAKAQSTVILASLAQPEPHQDASDTYRENRPLPMFLEHAQAGLINVV